MIRQGADAEGYDLRAIQFLALLDALPSLTIIPFDAEALHASARVVKRFADQKLTLADAHGIALMKDRRIATCWSTDRHLALGGATLVS